MAKPKVAFFEFDDCEGCQLAALDLTAQELLDLLSVVDIVEFREAMSEKGTTYDIAIIEGSITRDSEIPRLQDIRNRSKLVIAFGACAHIGGFNAIKNFQKKEEYTRAAYPEAPDKYETTTARAIGEIIKVDVSLPECPINTQELLRVVKNLVLGKNPSIPDLPVCTECKNKENVCVFHRGQGGHCLGPITRGGCGARCPSGGGYCFGCRGLISHPNIKAHTDMMRKYATTYGLNFEQMLDTYKLCLERSKEMFHHEQ